MCFIYIKFILILNQRLIIQTVIIIETNLLYASPRIYYFRQVCCSKLSLLLLFSYSSLQHSFIRTRRMQQACIHKVYTISIIFFLTSHLPIFFFFSSILLFWFLFSFILHSYSIVHSQRRIQHTKVSNTKIFFCVLLFLALVLSLSYSSSIHALSFSLCLSFTHTCMLPHSLRFQLSIKAVQSRVRTGEHLINGVNTIVRLNFNLLVNRNIQRTRCCILCTDEACFPRR